MANKSGERLWSPPQILTSVAVTAFLIAAFGFGWFGLPGLGWTTSGTAKAMAEEAVTARLVPICVAQARRAPAADLDAFADIKSWEQWQFVEKRGWATMPGSDSPERNVASPCAEALASD